MLLRIPSWEIVIGHGNVRAPHTVPRPRNVSSGWMDAPLSFTAIHNTRAPGLRRPRSRLINGPGWNFNDNSVYDFSWGRRWRKRLLVFASGRSTQWSTLDSVFGEEILSTRHGSYFLGHLSWNWFFSWSIRGCISGCIWRGWWRYGTRDWFFPSFYLLF